MMTINESVDLDPQRLRLAALDHARLGDLELAAQELQRILTCHDADAETHYALGTVLALRGDHVEAIAMLRRALALSPRHVGALVNLAGLLLGVGDPQGARGALERAAELSPETAEIHFNLGAVRRLLGDPAGACLAFHAASVKEPEWPEAHYQLGEAARASGDARRAMGALTRAVELRPEWPEAHHNLGVALEGAGAEDVAAQAYQRAGELAPQWELPHYNLAKQALRRHDPAAALEHLDAAIERAPTLAQARLDRALLLLQRGDLAEGLREYEWRWGAGGRTPPRAGYDQPVWDGSPFEGQTLLLWCEQGFGDNLQFVRFAQALGSMSGRVWIQTAPPLARLFERCPYLDRIIVGEPPRDEFDLQLPLMSLPRVLGATLDTIAPVGPYLTAPPDEVPGLRLDDGAFRVGIVWASGTSYAGHARRDCTVAEFLRLAKIPGVRLHSLQFGERAADLTTLGEHPIEDLSAVCGDFAQTAAIVEGMDLILSVDTALVHLAGALGCPVWTLLSEPADWRWMLGRSDTPWYPTMRLFRQQRTGDWSDVFAQVEVELRREVERRLSPPRSGNGFQIQVSAGELIDRITILEIKLERVTDPARRSNVAAALEALGAARHLVRDNPSLKAPAEELREINEQLWDAEDEVRRRERIEDFGPRFVAVARSIYLTNDRRAEVKRRIDELLGSHLVEEKSYA